MQPSDDKVQNGEVNMKQKTSLRSHIKAMPVIGPAAKLANRFRVGLLQMRNADMRRDALLRMKHKVSWYISRNPESQKRFVKHSPTLTAGQRELVESLATKGVAAASFGQAGIQSGDWSALEGKIGEFARLSTDRISAATASYSDNWIWVPWSTTASVSGVFFATRAMPSWMTISSK